MRKIKNIKLMIFFTFLSFVLFCFGAYAIHKKNNVKPELSIVLPVYNVAPYLPKCLESLTNQTFKNIEIILVNDGSTDNSLEILNNYKSQDKRIKVIDKKNGGVSSARNTGIMACRADFISFVDPDDYLSLDVYEKCMNTIQDTSADILAFSSITEPENRMDSIEKKIITNPFEAVSDPSINNGYVWNKIFRRSLLVENNILFKEDIAYAEDNLFVNMTLPKAKIIATCPTAVYHYQYHPNSSGNSISKEKRLIDAIKRCNYLIEYYIDEGYSDRFIWLLDFCLGITRESIDEIEPLEKRKYYATQLLEILDGKLLNNMNDIPESLNKFIEKIRGYANTNI